MMKSRKKQVICISIVVMLYLATLTEGRPHYVKQEAAPDSDSSLTSTDTPLTAKSVGLISTTLKTKTKKNKKRGKLFSSLLRACCNPGFFGG